MFTLAISCLATSNLSWFMDLTFRFLYHIVLYSIGLYFHHQTHLWLGVMFLFWPSHLILSGAISNYPLHFPSSILDTFWPGRLSFWHHIFLPFHAVHGILQARILASFCYFHFQRTTFCQNSSLWPIHLGWPCTAWLITSLSYISPFTTTRLWSMKGWIYIVHMI